MKTRRAWRQQKNENENELDHGRMKTRVKARECGFYGAGQALQKSRVKNHFPEIVSVRSFLR